MIAMRRRPIVAAKSSSTSDRDRGRAHPGLRRRVTATPALCGPDPLPRDHPVVPRGSIDSHSRGSPGRGGGSGA
jgi:hypothetical protein